MVFLISNASLAQFSASGGVNGAPYVYTQTASTGFDTVFVFNGIANAKLIYNTSTPSDWTWYKFEKDSSSQVLVPAMDVQITSTETVLNNIQTGFGYIVKSRGSEHSVYVVSYSPVDYNEISFVTDGDICNTMTLKVSALFDEMYYYTVSGDPKKLERKHTLTWNTSEWDATDKAYKDQLMTSTSSNLAYNWSITAPLTDTYFTVSGDQFADFFGSTTRFQDTTQYAAVAVKTNAQTEMILRTADNELEKISTSGDLSGSAPLNIQFYSHPSNAVTFYEWYIYESADANGNYKRYTDENLLHSFQETGTFLVKLFVSNGSCKDSASFTPKISESFIDCPNFFTPRSSPGDNDEFRVAYKSIVSFKGVIVNRWGNTLFQWSDPALGWDGTFKGKAVSPGVYFYLIEAKGSDGIVYKKKGDINLLE